MKDVQIPRSVYNRLSEYLVEEYLKDTSKTQIEEMYKELTGDSDLSELKKERVYREIKGFIDSINEVVKASRLSQVPAQISIEDQGYDNGTFYIRFWVNDFNFALKNQKDIIAFLQNVADRTGVSISPEFNYYEKLEPSIEKPKEKIQAPVISYNKLMDVELNQS